MLIYQFDQCRLEVEQYRPRLEGDPVAIEPLVSH